MHVRYRRSRVRRRRTKLFYIAIESRVYTRASFPPVVNTLSPFPPRRILVSRIRGYTLHYYTGLYNTFILFPPPLPSKNYVARDYILNTFEELSVTIRSRY